jgi:hypothetical protein
VGVSTDATGGSTGSTGDSTGVTGSAGGVVASGGSLGGDFGVVGRLVRVCVLVAIIVEVRWIRVHGAVFSTERTPEGDRLLGLIVVLGFGSLDLGGADQGKR